MIYVDDPMSLPGNRFDGYCHMWGDGPLDELIAFAQRLGLRANWLQHSSAMGGTPHFDISRSKRAQALKNGAQAVNLRAYIKARQATSQPAPDPLFYAYLLYTAEGEPHAVWVCSGTQEPTRDGHNRAVLVAQALTQGDAMALGQSLLNHEMVEWKQRNP